MNVGEKRSDGCAHHSTIDRGMRNTGDKKQTTKSTIISRAMEQEVI